MGEATTEYGPVLIIVLQLIFLEGILSIDNAAVIGALVSTLPDDQHVVRPETLKRFGEWLHPLLGNQHMAALCVSLLGAYVGRGMMLFLSPGLDGKSVGPASVRCCCSLQNDLLPSLDSHLIWSKLTLDGE